MKRICLFVLTAAIVWSFAPAAASAQEKDILGKSIGEWIKMLRDDERPNYRRAALKALELGLAAPRTALGSILEAAEKDKDATVRRDAVALIGRLGPDSKGTFKTLLSVLQNDKAGEVREAAATALGGKFVEGKAIEALQEYLSVIAEYLKDAHAGTRLATATTLRHMGKHAEPAVPALLEVAKKSDEEPLVRVVAIHIVSRHGKSESRTWPLLVALLVAEDSPANVKEAAAEALGRSATDATDVILALEKTLTAKDIELRKAAAISLSSLGVKAKASWPTVKARLTDAAEKQSGIRNHLIRLAGALGKDQPEAVTSLADLAVKDESTENRIAAIQELGELGAAAKSALPVLTRLATQDARAAVRDEAATAVKRINK